MNHFETSFVVRTRRILMRCPLISFLDYGFWLLQLPQKELIFVHSVYCLPTHAFIDFNTRSHCPDGKGATPALPQNRTLLYKWMSRGVALSDRRSTHVPFYVLKVPMKLYISLADRQLTYATLRILSGYQCTSPYWFFFTCAVIPVVSISFLHDWILNSILNWIKNTVHVLF